MANELPPLPIQWLKVTDPDGVEVPVFRAFQMRDFARAAVLAERERVLSIVLMAPFMSEHADEVDDDIKAFAFDLGTLIRKGEPAQQASPQADLFGAPHE